MNNSVALQTLQKYWGYDAFRSPQDDIIEQVLQQKDCFVMLPTGGGKSLCYQLPAILQKGITIVVSPLIALMDDQVSQLIKRGINAVAFHSALDENDKYTIIDKILNGDTQLIYCSSEQLMSESFLQLFENINCSLLAVDEAHCISQWGHDFRPAYRQIIVFKNNIRPTTTMALTASATPKVQADILEQLGLEKATIFKTTVTRPNLQYQVRYSENKANDILAYFEKEKNNSSIIYCGTRKKTEQLATFLNDNKLSAIPYHAGMSAQDRTKSQELWMQNERNIICATSAFGMGIDKPDVRTVIHLKAPESPEEYYQEAGRAGRDGKESTVILYYNNSDITALENVIDYKFPNEEIVLKCYEAICNSAQIAVGEGFERKYFFDVIYIAQKHKIPTFVFINALKLIEQSGYWIFNTDDKRKHSATFTCNRTDIESLQNINPNLYDVAIHLLRIHGDIYHYYTSFSILHDASIMGISYEQFLKRLQELDHLGIIDFRPAQQGSSVYFMEDRVNSKAFKLNKKYIQTQKETLQEHIKNIIAYTENNSICRSKILAQYFGEKDSEDCGVCDVCKKRTATFDLQNIIVKMKSITDKDGALPIAELNKYFRQEEISFITEQFEKMLQEGMIQLNGTNIIFAK